MAKKIISLITLLSLLAWSVPIQVLATVGDGSGTYNVPFNTDTSAKKNDVLISQNFFSGAVEQSINVTVPPGRNGMQPSVALSYSSLNGNSIAGQGWSLNLSFIKRSTKFGLPAFTNSDTFEYTGALGSDELVLVNDDTHEYRLKNENFTKFILQNSGDLANEYWQVFDKSGNQYFFGEADAFRLKDGTKTAEWHISRQIDTQPDYNIIEYQYTKDQNQIYPDKILYGKTKQNYNNHASVDLTYESRPDIYDSFVYGFKVVTANRLSKIETKLNNNLVRSYQLTYIQSTANISLLVKVKECGSDGSTCLPEREFAYQQNPTTSSGANGYTSTIPGNITDANGVDQGFRFVDVNGDGLTDVLKGYASCDDKTNNCTDDRHAWLNTGTGWQYDTTWKPPVFFTELRYNSAYPDQTVSFDTGVIFGDINNDGLIDMIYSRDHAKYTVLNSPPSITYYRQVYLNNGHGWTFDTNLSSKVPIGFINTIMDVTGYPLYWYKYWNVKMGAELADVNNDGWLDIVYAYFNVGGGAYRGVYLNNKNGWTFSQEWTNSLPVYFNSYITQMDSHYPQVIANLWNRDEGARLADINNDGLVDIIQSRYLSSDWNVRKIWLNNGHGWAEDTAWSTSFYNLNTWFTTWQDLGTGFGANNYDYGARIFDINGDGLLDIIQSFCPDKTTCVKNAYINNGHGFEANNTSWANIMNYAFSDFTRPFQDLGYRYADVNGDGITDLFFYLTGYPLVSLTTGGLGLKENIMLTAKNIYGGKTQYEYNPGTKYDNTGLDDISDLSQVIDVVKKVKQVDWNNVEKSTVINYQDGKYDSLNRQMAGFGRITVTDEKGNKQEIFNRQNDWDKGRVKEAIYYDNSSPAKKYSRAVNEYALDNVSNPTKPYINPQVAETKEDYNGSDIVQKTKKTEYQYDQYGNVALTKSLGDTSISGDEKSAVSSYAYNLDKWLVNRVKTSLIKDQNDIQKAKTDYYYDYQSDLNASPIYGNLTKKVSWLSSETSPAYQYSYDFNGNLVESIDPKGNLTETFYDTTYNIFPSQKIYSNLMDEKFTYDPATGNLLTATDFNNQISSNVYDALGQLIEVYKPGGQANYASIKYSYSWTQAPVLVKQMSRIEQWASPPQWPLSHYTYYDGFGRVIETKDFTLAVDNPNNLAVINATSYNQQGLAEKTWRPYFSANNQANDTYVVPDPTKPQTTYEYDALQRPTKITNPDGCYKANSYNGWTTTAYDENNHRKDLTYDAYGHLIQVKEYDNSPIYTTGYQYDTLGNLVNITDNQGNQTTYAYDTLGRKLSQNDPDMGLWRYTYDANGNLMTQKDARSKVTTYSYDPLNRLIAKKYSDGFTEKRLYDETASNYAKGRLSSVIDRVGTTRFYYDVRGREVKTEKIIDRAAYVFTREYDNADRLYLYTLPDGTMFYYTYNWQNMVASVSGGISEIKTNALGQTTEIRFSNWQRSKYTYDPLTARISRFEVKNENNPAYYTANYSFDSEGNLASLQETGDNSFSFSYDNLDRLTQANGGAVNYSYNYNSIGNILSNEGTNYYYGTKPHAVINTSKGFSAQYDANGNMVNRNSEQMVYDDDNQITNWKSADGLTQVQYKYNYSGQRVKKDSSQQYYEEPIPVIAGSEGGVTQTAIKLDTSFRTSYNFVQTSPLITSSPNLKTVKHKNLYVSDDYEIRDGMVTKYIILNGQKLVSITGSQKKYYHLDYLGSTKLVTDSVGQTLEKIYFKPFGATKQDTSSSITPYKYTGKELDSENNLYYYGARYYDANLGRFITADSIIPSFGNPQSLNRYSYVVNNPYKYVDPSGHFYWEGFVGGAANAVGGAVGIAGGLTLFFGGAATSPTGVGVGAALLGAGVFVWGAGNFMQGLGSMYVAANTDASSFQAVEPIREGYQVVAGDDTKGDLLYYGTDLGFSLLTPKGALLGSKYLNAIVNTIDKEQDVEAAAKLGVTTLKYNNESAKEEQEKREADCLLSNSCISSIDDLLGKPSSNQNTDSQTSSDGSGSSVTAGSNPSGLNGGGGGGAGNVSSGSVQEMIQRGIYY